MLEKVKQNKFVLLIFLTGIVYFFLKYIAPAIGPVLIAMLFVTMFGPFLKRMQQKFRIHRQVGAVILLAAASILFVVLVWVLFSWIVGSLPGWIEQISKASSALEESVHDICDAVGRLVGVDGLYLEATIWSRIEEGFNILGQRTVPGVLSQSLTYVRFLGVAGGFMATFLIATILLARDYDDIMNRLLNREDCRVLLEVICGVIRYIATFVKAQLVIMTAIGTLSAITLGFAGIHNGVLWGMVAGILDALPFVGTGIVLMPLAVLQIFTGSYGRAVVCIILYVVCIFARELLEPRLIGRQIGVPAIAVLLSLYAGIRLFGVGGIVKGPLGFILIRQIYLSILNFGDRTKEKNVKTEQEESGLPTMQRAGK